MAVKKRAKKLDLSFLDQTGSASDIRFIRDYDVLDAVVKEIKRRKLRVVLTQGVYDLIHEGHAKYLEMAKSYGDVLIVGLDSDKLTKARKGKNRPIVPQKERVEMLVHLRHVDLVVLRELKHDIGYLIRLVKPHVLITSETTKDFTKVLVREYKDFADEIVTLPAQSTTSTTARIRNLTIQGAEDLADEIAQAIAKFIRKIRSS